MVILRVCSFACISTTNCISSVYLLLPNALFVANELLRSKFRTSNDVVNGLLNGEKERSSVTLGLLWRFCFFEFFSALTLLSLLVVRVVSPTFDEDSSLISTSHKFWAVFCLHGTREKQVIRKEI